jgi:ATP-dependent helicase/nuclease subunit A
VDDAAVTIPDAPAADPVDADSAGSRWLRPPGEAATAFGRAVHATLQDVSLPTAADVDAVAARHARAEGATERAADVARSVRAALASPTVRQIVEGGRYWREVYVGTPIGETVVEGFVDLLGETADGLVVVDYKTDAGDPDELVARYRGQLAAYAAAVGAAAGRPVVRALLVCCGRPGDAVEREVTDLPALQAAVAAAVRRTRT